MPSLDLNGETLERLSDALRDAFTVQRLREMLKFKLGKRLDDYSLGSDYKEIVFELITAAEAEGWTAELLVAARQSNPGNARLQAVAEEVALAVSTPELERTIKEKNPFLDVEVFRTKLGEVEAQVCRVEIDTPRGTVYGTGFLLGPDVLMTNHHVMESIVSGKVPPSSAVFRFDYKRLPTAVIADGSTFKLAPDWLIDYSPPSAVDLKPEPKPGTPRPDELDYALVRLAGAPGNAPVGQKTDPNAPKRGWIKLPGQGVPAEAGVAAADPAAPRLGAAEARARHERRDRPQRQRHAAQVQGEHRGRLVRRALFQHRLRPPRTASQRRSELRSRVTSRNTTRGSRSTRS